MERTVKTGPLIATGAMGPILAAHYGVGSTPDLRDAAQKAVTAGVKALRKGGTALDAVEEAVVILEDDPRTNAGTGSRMRIDGSIQMDAGLMDSRLRVGAVAVISDVKNPIRVARKVMDTPHIQLAGEWATRFARQHGFPFHDPATERSRERLEQTLGSLAQKRLPAWARAWRRYGGTDTVGAVARDANGRYAAGNSTGGVSLMLPGRVGDSPVVGAGLYAGPAGAVTATGVGEEIMRVVLSKFVYDRLEGLGAQAACDAGLRLFPRSVPIGLLAVGKDGLGEADNREMAWWANGPRLRARKPSSSRPVRR